MGTRGLIGHISRGKKKASYNHYDSYPKALGVNIVRFIESLSPEQIEQMRKMVENLEWVNEQDPVPKEVRERYIAFNLADLKVGTQSADNWYCLLRNVQGAKCLPHILEGSLTHQIDSTEFEQDELFCEWAYFVDWEKQALHVGGGVNKACPFAELTVEWMEKLQSEEDGE